MCRSRHVQAPHLCITMMKLKLYNHHRSSASFRARIALNLKGVEYESIFVDLLKGEQRESDFHALNPERLVPVLEVDGTVLSQSLAIIDFLEEAFPQPPLLPSTPQARARVRSFALAIACDIHPLNNLRVLQYLTGTLGLAATDKDAWYRHWIREGFGAVSELVEDGAQFCFGDRPTLADVLLIPQIANARRTNCDLAPYPKLLRIEAHCMALEPFQRAAPESQAIPAPT